MLGQFGLIIRVKAGGYLWGVFGQIRIIYGSVSGQFVSSEKVAYCVKTLSRRNSMKKITNNCCFVLVKLSLAEEDIDSSGKAL